MSWSIAAPFFRPSADPAALGWIDDFAPPGAPAFRKVPMVSAAGSDWHGRATRGTPLGEWREFWTTAGKALAGAEGVVTVFPPLATMVGVRRRLGRAQPPVIAWCFNIGRFPGGAKRAAARVALGGIERFVVHSSAEVGLVTDYLGLAPGTVRFVPLQRAPIATLAEEERAEPFVVAMGSANRDYGTLVEAARLNRLPTLIVAGPRAVAGLDLPANVTVRSGLTPEDCFALAQRARISVIPLADMAAASGQVTILEAMRMRRPLIATRTIGTTDYVRDGETGLLVEAGDPAALSAAMMRLWDDAPLRDRLAEAGHSFVAQQCSDEAAGAALVDIIAGLGRK